MTVELGCLLGAYGGAQSFESVGSWALQSAQSSFGVQTSDVHSSPSGGLLEVWSSALAADALRYDHDAANDVQDRWSADVTTHRIVSYLWARIDAAAHSGDAAAELCDVATAPIAEAAALARYRLEAQATSADALQVDLRRLAATGSFGLYLDDVLTAVDVLDLHPGVGAREGMEQRAGQHVSAGQAMRRYVWHDVPVWELPLRHMASSEADLINRWWREGRNLAFTFDSSDTAQTWVARIVNPGPPFTGFRRPYFDRHDGIVQLAAVHKGLDF